MRNSTTHEAPGLVSKSPARTLAAVLATALVAGGLSFAAAAPASAVVPGIVTDADLAWGFNTYTVANSPAAQFTRIATTGNVVTDNAASTLGFIAENGTGSVNAAGNASVAFTGSVQYKYTHDFASVYTYEFSDFEISTTGTRGSLSAIIEGTEGFVETAAQNTRVVLANFDVTSLKVTSGVLELKTAAPDYAPTSSFAFGAWPATLLDAIPSAGKSFWGSSAETTSQLSKKPLALSVAGAVSVSTTTTALTISPAEPGAASPVNALVAGTSVTLNSAVATDESGVAAQGTVEFFQKIDGTTETVSLGTAPVVAGVASYSFTPSAGGRAFSAKFTGALGFSDSTSAVSNNYRVADTTRPSLCVPSTSAVTSTDATASWGWSDYKDFTGAGPQWTEVALGDITYDTTAKKWNLTGGDVTQDNSCAVVQFDGTIRTVNNNFRVDIDDPYLTIKSDGTGAWSGTLSVYNTSNSTFVTPATDVTIVTFSSVGGLIAARSGGAVDIAFNYANTVPSGTWSATRTSAWHNNFIYTLPASMRGFYFASGSVAGDPLKVPSNLGASFAWSALQIPVSVALEASSGSAVYGSPVTLTAAVSGAEGASVEFFDGTTSIGTATLAGGRARLDTSALAPGTHSITAVLATAGYAGTSAPVAVTVSKVGTATTLTLGAVSVASGATTTATASIAPATAGTVTFTENGTSLGTVAVTGGVATLTLPALAAGAHPIVATFSGSATHESSVSTVAVVTVAAVVAPALLAAKAAVSAKAFTKGTKPKVSVSLGKLSNGKYATGKVRIYVGNKLVKTVTLKAGNKGKLTVKLPKKYSKTIKIKIKYLGSSTVKAKTSTTIKVRVK